MITLFFLLHKKNIFYPWQLGELQPTLSKQGENIGSHLLPNGEWKKRKNKKWFSFSFWDNLRQQKKQCDKINHYKIRSNLPLYATVSHFLSCFTKEYNKRQGKRQRGFKGGVSVGLPPHPLNPCRCFFVSNDWFLLNYVI